MKKSTLIIVALAAVSLVSMGSVYAANSSSIKSYAEGTSFQDHSEGKYGPPGAGGYGPPESLEAVEDNSSVDETAKKKPLFQDVTEGTSFQGHSEGTYGPVGSGGYGLPDLPDNAK